MKISAWLSYSLQALWIAALAALFLFAASNTTRLADSERKIQANALRDPQSSNPATAYVEILLPPPALPQLSAGYMGIAPSMHLIRILAARPLSNIDPIEHPARRRFGRVDLNFAFLLALPVAILPLCFLVYRNSLASGAVAKLKEGRVSLFDFCIESIFLPLGVFLGLLLLTTLGALYTNGLRIASNEALARLSLWALIVGVYLLVWFLLFVWCLLRQPTFAGAALSYSAWCVLILLGLPLTLHTIESTLVPPHARLAVVLERRQLIIDVRNADHAQFDRFLQSRGAPAFDWSQPLAPSDLSTLTNLLIEDRLAPRIATFEASVKSLDQFAQAASWLSPLELTQSAIDDLAGTGLSRYSRFRTASLAYFDQWQRYMLPFLAKRRPLDFDALRAAPKFQFKEEDSGWVLGMAAARALYLFAFAALLIHGIRRQLKSILPKKANAAR